MRDVKIGQREDGGEWLGIAYVLIVLKFKINLTKCLLRLNSNIF